MLTVFAAETQFRLDSAQLDREHEHLAAIRARAAEDAPRRRRSTLPSLTAVRGAWPRPIGVHHPEPACA